MELYSMATVAMGGLLAITALLLLCAHCNQRQKRRESVHSQEIVKEENKLFAIQHQDKENTNLLGNVGKLDAAADNSEAMADSDSRDSALSSGWTPAPPICGGVDFCRQSYGYISPNSRGSQRTSSQTDVGSKGTKELTACNGVSLSASATGTIAAWRLEIEEMSGTRPEFRTDGRPRGLSGTSDASSEANYDTASDMSNLSDKGEKEHSIFEMKKRYRMTSEKDTGHSALDKTNSKRMASDTDSGGHLTFVQKALECLTTEHEREGHSGYAGDQGMCDVVDTSEDDEEYSVPPPRNTRQVTDTSDKSHYQIPKLIMGKM